MAHVASPPAGGLDLRGAEVYDSARRPAPAVEEFLQLLRYRDLVAQLVSRNIKARYKRSVLGVAWTMLNPLLMMIVMTIVFSNVLRVPIPHYPVFLLAGLLAWTFFTQTTSAAMSELVWGSALMNKIYVPRTIFVASAIGTGLVNLTLALIPLLIVMLADGVMPRWTLLLLPLPTLLLVAFAAGVGLLMSTFVVRFADVMDIYQLVLTALTYLSPLLYTIDIIPEPYRPFFGLNPMFHLLEAFRSPIYSGRLPAAHTLAVSAAWAGGALALGWWVFTRKADDVVYRV
jgi:ABC-type polysaccharide/polyol phosphate export permease